MPRIGDTNFNHNRRELYTEAPLEQSQGGRTEIVPPDPTKQLVEIQQEVPDKSIEFIKLLLDRILPGQNLQSADFVPGVSGWIIRGDGSAEFNGGGLSVSELHIPDENTTDDSMHVDTEGNTWWGCTHDDFTADHDNATAYILKDGTAKFFAATVNGRTLTSEPEYGDGSDGNVTLTADTSLSRDMFYDTLTLNYKTTTGAATLPATGDSGDGQASRTSTGESFATMRAGAGTATDSGTATTLKPQITGQKYALPPTGTSGDGYAQRTTASASWATLRDSAGTAANSTTTTTFVKLTTGVGTYASYTRAILPITNGLDAGAADITSATLEIYVTAKVETLTGHSISLVYRTDPGTIDAADYNVANWTMTKLANDLTIASLTTSAYNTFTLNAAGLALINANKGGKVTFGIVLTAEPDGTTPTLVNSSEASVTFNTIDNSVATAPRLNTGSSFCTAMARVIMPITNNLPVTNYGVVSASLRIYVASVVQTLTGKSLSLVYRTNPGTIGTSDYDVANWTMTKIAADLPISGLTTSAYNTFVFNATGLALIAANPSAPLYFGIVISDDADSTTPVFTDNQEASVTFNAVDNASNKPDLTVAYYMPITLSPNGYKIFCKTQLDGTIRSTISAMGNDGGTGGNNSSGSGGTGGIAGSASPAGSLPAALAGAVGGNGGFTTGIMAQSGGAANAVTLSLTNSSGGAGGNGGSGGSSSGTAGGGGSAGGTITSVAKAGVRNLVNALTFVDSGSGTGALYGVSGGAGAGGGGGYHGISNRGGGGGGGGGGNGGNIVISAKTITVGANTSILATGGNGGTGGNGAGGGGGGGGGAGGCILLIYTTLSNSGTIVAAGGTGGSGGSTLGYTGGVAGTQGQPGASGIVLQLQRT